MQQVKYPDISNYYTKYKFVVKLKGRTCRLLPPMSQPGFAVQRETTIRVLYVLAE